MQNELGLGPSGLDPFGNQGDMGQNKKLLGLGTFDDENDLMRGSDG